MEKAINADKVAWMILGKQLRKVILFALLGALCVALILGSAFELYKLIKASEHAEVIISMAPYSAALLLAIFAIGTFLFCWKENIKKDLMYHEYHANRNKRVRG